MSAPGKQNITGPHGDGPDGHVVGTLSASVPLNYHSAENSAACGSQAVGGLEIPLGVLTGQ